MLSDDEINIGNTMLKDLDILSEKIDIPDDKKLQSDLQSVKSRIDRCIKACSFVEKKRKQAFVAMKNCIIIRNKEFGKINLWHK